MTLRFLLAVIGGRPFALLVEDAQFVDDSSAELLRRLSRAASSLPNALLLTETGPAPTWPRDDDESEQRLEFALLPLSQAEATEMLEIATDAEPLRPHEVEELARRSGGSPLFLVELLNVARSTGTSQTLPDSIEAVVTADIDRLSPSDKIVLRYASVLGMAFGRELLRVVIRDEVAFDDGIWGRLTGLVDSDLDGSLRFRNSLVHDTAYEGLPFRRRRELHARVAEAIEAASESAEDDAATLALHYAAAARSAETWRYARVAGDRARAVAANVEAARLYELALAAGRRLRAVTKHERADVLVSLARAQDMAGLMEESYDTLCRASGLLTADPLARAQTYTDRSHTQMRMGSVARSLRETTHGLRLIAHVDSREASAARASLTSMRAQAKLLQGHNREAIDLADRAAEEARRSDELEALGRAYGVLDEAYQRLGEHEKVVHERLALDLYRELGHLRTVGLVETNLGHQAQWAGRWDEAIDWLRRAQEDCSAAGDRPSAANAAVILGEILVNRGALEEAEKLLRDARRVLRAAGFMPPALLAETHLARIPLAHGRPEEALTTLRSILAEAEATGNTYLVVEVALHLAAAARATAPSEGLAVLEAAAHRAGDEAAQSAVTFDRTRGGLLTALGSFDEARERLGRALDGARERSLPYEELLTLRERARLARALGEPVNAEELREADRLAQLLGLPGVDDR